MKTNEKLQTLERARNRADAELRRQITTRRTANRALRITHAVVRSQMASLAWLAEVVARSDRDSHG